MPLILTTLYWEIVSFTWTCKRNGSQTSMCFRITWTALWNENISCNINKQKTSQPSVISGLQMWIRAPQTAVQGVLPPPPTEIAEELGECKKQGEQGDGWSPDSWGAYERNEFSEPRGLHLLIHRKVSSLTWYLIFDVQTACSLCYKLVYSLTSPLPPWSSFLRDTEMLSPGLGVLNLPTK